MVYWNTSILVRRLLICWSIVFFVHCFLSVNLRANRIFRKRLTGIFRVVDVSLIWFEGFNECIPVSNSSLLLQISSSHYGSSAVLIYVDPSMPVRQ